MKLLYVKMQGSPKIEARAVMPYADNKEIKNRNTKQFEVLTRAALIICFEDKAGEHSKVIKCPAGYVYDGATIPFNIGKGDMRLLIPALWHDIMCENKKLINYNRKLSSMIFRELLLQCGSPKINAQIKYLAVEMFQRMQKEWN